MRILYFAWVRERVGLESEELDVPAQVRTVAELAAFLKERGEGYAHAFENPRVVRAALDRRHARPEAPLGGAREIAFFPPMTGG
ncbi:molybdopterin converting factor subunit 1 [Starkeya koreensis]|uniref:Molybdopterin converting factor subunit 1 n=1 Tax=Ancylobacter koreensis TaxID=266121 RepID=A0ABT0DPZ5_9HYPH|nr:molybdopterin converting factor subunit 1 [Ancylobacter koreensis]